MFPFSYSLHQRFLPFFVFLYNKLDNTSYSMELVSSLHMKNETTPMCIFLSHSQSRFDLMNMDYCKNSTIFLSVHQIILELSFFFFPVRTFGEIFWIKKFCNVPNTFVINWTSLPISLICNHIVVHTTKSDFSKLHTKRWHCTCAWYSRSFLRFLLGSKKKSLSVTALFNI